VTCAALRRLRRLPRAQAGVTVIEFALIIPVLLLMLMGFFDLAHRQYVAAILQGEIENAGRRSGIQAGLTNLPSIDAAVEQAVRPIVSDAATFSSERLGYTNFTDIGTPEEFDDKAPFNNKYDPGECFYDVNGNKQWDADRGRTGQGGAQDVIVYRVTVSFPRLFPMNGLLGWDENQSVSGSTVLRNQPYAQQRIERVKICS
jgi:hypothetical protein